MRSNQRLVEKFGSDSISNIVKALTTTSHIHHNYVFLDARRVITIDEDAIKDGAVVWHVSEEKFMEIFKEEEAKLGDARDCHCSSIEDGRSYPAIFSDQDSIQFYRRRSRRKKPPTGQLIDRRMIIIKRNSFHRRTTSSST